MNKLIDFRTNIFSQKGQDGVLSEVFKRANITRGFCVELGAWDGVHLSNTRTLIQNGWHGVLIEANQEKFNSLCHNNRDYPGVSCVHALVDCKNIMIEDILAQCHCPQDFDFLSIDVDGDDYHIWNSMSVFAPKFVLIETSIELSISKDNIAALGNTTPPISSSPFSVYKLGVSKGYTPICFIAHDWLFVRNDLLPLLNVPCIDYRQLYFEGTEMRRD